MMTFPHILCLVYLVPLKAAYLCFFLSLECNEKAGKKGDGVVVTLHIFIREISVLIRTATQKISLHFVAPPGKSWRKR
jgi:hypothetical protein